MFRDGRIVELRLTKDELSAWRKTEWASLGLALLMLGVALTACGSVFVIVSWLNSFYHMESFVYGVLALVVVILGVNGWKILAQRLKEKKQRLLVRFGDVPLEKVGRPSSGATYVILPQK